MLEAIKSTKRRETAEQTGFPAAGVRGLLAYFGVSFEVLCSVVTSGGGGRGAGTEG